MKVENILKFVVVTIIKSIITISFYALFIMATTPYYEKGKALILMSVPFALFVILFISDQIDNLFNKNQGN